jgi:hypothetical protein
MNDLRPKDGLVDIPIKVIKKINGKMFKHPTGDNTSNGSRVEFSCVTCRNRVSWQVCMYSFNKWLKNIGC